MKILVELPEWQYKEIKGNKGISEGVMINALCAIRLGKPLEQELTTKNDSPKYCDRNICLKNEYNNIGCEDCEVTKSQEPATKNDLGVDCIDKWDIGGKEAEAWIVKGKLQIRHRGTIHNIDLPAVTPQEPLKPMVEIDLDYVIKQKYIEREVLDKIREQIKSNLRGVEIALEVLFENHPLRPKMEGAKDTLEECLELIDKYKAGRSKEQTGENT